ncbi:DNA polymerase I [Pontibacter sp. G13]|uniref:DNA polymerase I n=1 Tax=Pontibacter sp. G13 TaxID=3074898 RepID=UPI00288A9E6D|nr:DNA polymerase I [Pontibacter sp. G13]WNJ17645.1 DNA polymerase I [Pontibacter sp. G13]
MPKQKIFLLDAMALLYRAFFAFQKNPRITKEGLNTSAVFGFANTLLEIINKEDPTHLAVAFDTSEPTFRHVQFPEYKAQREAMPEDLATAIPYAYRLLEVLNIPALRLPGYEADDIIGTISAQVDPAEYDVYMVTPDKDYAQLVKENVFLYKPAFRGGGFDVYDTGMVEEKFGVKPDRIIDFLGLKGDSVDNIPGIPKVGDKTAVALINEFGTVEEIVARVDDITRKAIQKSVREFGEQGILSKELATIHTSVPIEYSLDEIKLTHMDLEATQKLMGELEFRTTAQRLLNSKLNPARMDQQIDLFNQGGNGGAAPQMVSSIKTIENTEHTYALLETVEDRQKWIKQIQEKGAFCFDTETTGLDPMQADLVGLSISTEPSKGAFIHFPSDMDRLEIQAILGEFREVMTSPDILKIGQNLKYDILMLRNYDMEVEGPMFDTMLAHYVVKPEGKHGMDALAEEFLNYQPVSIESLIGKKGKKQKTMHDVELDKLVEYASEDADITLQLHEKLKDPVKDNKVFNQIEQPLMPVLAAMEFEGIKLDDEALAEYSIDLGQRLEVLEKEIYELAGEEFNINSPRQLGDIMFGKLGLGKGEKQKKTKTGQYVTDEATLTVLAVSHELPDRILAYRGVKKLKSTYVDALPKLINPKTGRIHTTFSQSVAVTGRLSSVNPNLQNIPIRTADGREVRKGFIPRNEDYILLSADYSQVELRIMAAMSGDENMISAFQNKEDIHRATAARVFGVEPEEVDSTQRSRAKTVNFGIIYGISAFGLSQRMGISRKESKEIIETYFAQYPRVKAFMDECVDKAKEQGYVETLFGRRRNLPDINSRNATIRGFAERNAINSPIQGSAADIIKLAMINIQKAMLEQNLKSRMVLQVHDELVFDVHKDELDLMKALVHDKMTHAVNLAVPMEVEMGTGQNWLEAH